MEVVLTKEYITGLIDKKGMSKAEFAKQMGVQRQNLDALLESKKKDINTIIKMSEVLGIPFLEFIGMQKKSEDIHGCIFVNGDPVVVNSKEELLKLAKTLEDKS